MQRRKRRNEKKNQRKMIILSTILLSFTLITAYSAFSTKLTLNAKGNVIDKSRTIQSWSDTSKEDFHSSFYRQNIVTVTFLDTAKVPEKAKENWDVSASKDGGVMAYVVESSSETGKYDLFIGAKDGVIANEDSSNLFCGFIGIKEISFGNNFDTSTATTMVNMFSNCLSLTELDLSTFNTENVTDMKQMFWGQAEANPMHLKTITFGELFDTKNVTSMKWMFANCNFLQTINGIENFDTKNVTNLDGLFYGCRNLTELNLCSFNTRQTTIMAGMFRSTPKLTKIKVGPNWTTTNADTTTMFANSGVSQVTTGEC